MPVSWLTGIPGLKIVAPSTPADAKGLLKAAIRDDNPVDLLRAQAALLAQGRRSAAASGYELGRAAVVREGSDVTLVSAMKGVHDCLAAADLLAAEGVSAEVIDLRTLRPLDARGDRALRREDEPHRRRRGGAAHRRLGEARCSRSSPSTRSATSTTRGASRPRTRRFRTARRWRTRSCPGPERIAAEVRSRP